MSLSGVIGSQNGCKGEYFMGVIREGRGLWGWMEGGWVGEVGVGW